MTTRPGRPTKAQLESRFGPTLAWSPVPGCGWGSRIVKGPVFSVVDIRGPVFGPTYHSQVLADRLGVICYAEAHANAAAPPKPGKAPASQAMVIIPAGHTAPKTQAWARAYLSALAREGLNAQTPHVLSGKGSGNVARIGSRRPAMLLEPGFLTDPEFAAFIRTGEGIDALGRALAHSIIQTFPEGGLVGLRIGHAFRTSPDDPYDPGASIPDAFDADRTEDEHAEAAEWDDEIEVVTPTLGAAAEILTAYRPEPLGMRA